MSSFLTSLGAAIIMAATAFAGILGYHPSFGTTIYQSPALFETSLASAIGASDTSMTLVSGTLRDGTTLSGNYCFTIDSGLTNTEYICGTASGTAVTNLVRGIGSDGFTSYASLKYVHRYGADVKITDFPQLQQLTSFSNGVASYPNVLSYATSVTNFPNSSNIVSKGYVDGTVISGGAPITTSTPGIGLLASSAQTSAGTATGTYNAQTYNLLPANSLFNQTSSATTLVPVTGSSGKLSDGFIDHTASYTNSGNVTSTGSQVFASSTTFNASSTLTVNSVASFTGTTTFSGSVFGAGFGNVQVFSTVGTSTWTRPAGISKIQIIVVGGGGNGGKSTSGSSGGRGGGGGGGTAIKILDVSSIASTTVTIGDANATSSFGAYVSASGGSSPADDSMSGAGGGIGIGGDVNIQGGTGGTGFTATTGTYGARGGSSSMGGESGGAVQAGTSITNGSSGNYYGGGGGGCADNSSGSPASGGAGAQGIVIVYY